MPLTACQKTVTAAASVAASVAAILLWGVGAEAAYFGDYIHSGMLLLAAALATALESLTAWQYIDWRRSRYQTDVAELNCRMPKRLQAVDTYRRAIVYTMLSVPCFVHLQRLWLPLLPGSALLLAAALYMVKHCCLVSRQRSIVKVPTFVRFKDEAATADTSSPAPPPRAAAAPIYSDATRLSHQSSFASTHSASSGQLISGSKDSGIEASQLQHQPQTSAISAVSVAESAKARRKPGLARACSSSPDRRCLIAEEDNLSLHD